MESQESVNPFTRKRRFQIVRSIIIWTTAILLIGGGIFFATRKVQSNILLLDVPSDATVQLNGHSPEIVADTRGLLIPVYPGKYRLQITAPNKIPFTQDITVPVGKTLAIRPLFSVTNQVASEDTANRISFVQPSPDGKAVYYLSNSQTRIYRLETGNQVAVPLTEDSIGPVNSVVWSSDPNVFLYTKADGTYLHEIPIYDFKTQQTVKISGTELISPVWDPTDSTRFAAALFSSSGEKSLIISNRTMSDVSRKIDLSTFTSPKIIWSENSKYIAVINRSTSYTTNNIWLYTLSDGSFEQVTTPGNILDATFSPDGKSLLFSQFENGNTVLHAVSTTDKKLYPISIQGQVSQAAWKDSSEFYLPKPGEKSFLLTQLSGNQQVVPFVGPDTAEVEGMFYFSQQKTLVFYTETAVYTVSM